MSVGVTRRGFASFAAAAAVTLATSPRPLQAQTPLRLTLDGRIEGPAAPFFLALARGYFKSEGLDVSIEPSAGGMEPITRVASGGYDLGLNDINTVIRYRDQNASAALKAVFVVNNRPSYAIIGRPSRGVTVPADLDGKRLGAPAAEHASAVWPAFAKLNGIDPARVRVLNVGIPVRDPMLAAGEVDAVTGTSFGTPINLREKGVPADDIATMLMASYGLELYGNSIVASPRVLAEKPDAVRGFVRAFVRGLKDTLANPAEAIEQVLPRGNGLSRELELERLRIVIRDSIVTPETRSNGFGGIDAARFETAMNQLGMAFSFKNRPKLGDIFDAAFLPPEEERRVE